MESIKTPQGVFQTADEAKNRVESHRYVCEPLFVAKLRIELLNFGQSLDAHVNEFVSGQVVPNFSLTLSLQKNNLPKAGP